MKTTAMKFTEAVLRLKERLDVMPPLVGSGAKHVRPLDWFAYRQLLERIS